MLWLGGRASILGLFAGLGFYAFFTRRYPSWKQLLFVTLSGVILLLAVWKLHLIDLGHFSEMIQRTLQAGSLEKLSNTRFDIWSGILEHLEGSWLLGNGPQSYYFYLGRDPMTIHAHNFLMQFLGEWGILGSVLFLYLLFKAFAYGWKLHGNGATRSPEHALSGSIIVALTVSGLFGGTYFFIQTSIYLALSYALWITPRRQR
jgi:O-antigen ligase